LRHGFVPNLVSDRAQSFLANLTQELFKICKIRHIKTSSYHPQLNQAAEVKNKTLALGLKAHLLQGHTDWPNKVPEITFAFNITSLPSIEKSPFVLVYHRNPRLAVDAQLTTGRSRIKRSPLCGEFSRSIRNIAPSGRRKYRRKQIKSTTKSVCKGQAT
jgi:hypothetical protein